MITGAAVARVPVQLWSTLVAARANCERITFAFTRERIACTMLVAVAWSTCTLVRGTERVLSVGLRAPRVWGTRAAIRAACVTNAFVALAHTCITCAMKITATVKSAVRPGPPSLALAQLRRNTLAITSTVHRARGETLPPIPRPSIVACATQGAADARACGILVASVRTLHTIGA